MPYASLADRNACAARNYAGKRSYFREKHRGWRERNPKRYAWLGQRHTSSQRNIDFNLTFEQFVEFWGVDFSKRGRKMVQMCMARYEDKGAYEMGNIYKTTNADNKAGPREKDEGLHENIPY